MIDTKWLRDLADDDNNWVNSVFSEYPTPIAVEYEDLKELASNGQIQGVIDELRDIYERLMKYPVIVTLCYLAEKSENNSEIRSVYYKAIGRWITKEQSTGDWMNLLRNLSNINKDNKKEIVPKPLENIMKETNKLLNKKIVPKSGETTYSDFCNWRNKVIGHGALREANDKNQREETMIMLERLKEYFCKKNVSEAYKAIKLYYHNELLEGTKRVRSNEKGDLIKLEINDNKLNNKLFYIDPDEKRIYFFDSYSPRRNKSKYIGYKGIAKEGNNHELRTLSEKVDKEINSVSFLEKLSKENYHNDVYTREASNALDELEEAKNYYIKIEEIERWLQEVFSKEKGCFELIMDRGMGKSALASYLIHKKEIYGEKCTIRTYHFSRMKIYGIKDFISQINYMFDVMLDNNNSGRDLHWYSDSFRLTDSNELKESRKTIAKYLNKYHEISSEYCNNTRTVLILDGIDELNGNISSREQGMIKTDFIKCLPKDEELNQGVFVLYLTRPAEVMPETVSETIKSIPVNVENVLRVTKNMVGYKKALADFIGCGSATKDIIEKSHSSFLEAKLYVELYNATGELDFDEGISLLKYLEILEKRYYGKPYYELIIKKYLLFLVVFRKGLSFKELKEITNTTTEIFDLIGTLYDLSPIITKERNGNGETVYRLANNDYYDILNEVYSEEIKDIKMNCRDYLLRLGEKVKFNLTFSRRNALYIEDKKYVTVLLNNIFDIIDDDEMNLSVLSLLIIISSNCIYSLEKKRKDISLVTIMERFPHEIGNYDTIDCTVFLAGLCLNFYYTEYIKRNSKEEIILDNYISRCFAYYLVKDINNREIVSILFSLISEYNFDKADCIFKSIDALNALKDVSLQIACLRSNVHFKESWFVYAKKYIDKMVVEGADFARYRDLECISLSYLYQSKIFHLICGEQKEYEFCHNAEGCRTINNYDIRRLKCYVDLLKIQGHNRLELRKNFLSENEEDKSLIDVDLKAADESFYEMCFCFLKLSSSELEKRVKEFRKKYYNDNVTEYHINVSMNYFDIFKNIVPIVFSELKEILCRFKQDYYFKKNKYKFPAEYHDILIDIKDFYYNLSIDDIRGAKEKIDKALSINTALIHDYTFMFFRSMIIYGVRKFSLQEINTLDIYRELEKKYLEFIQYEGVSRVLDRYFISLQELILSDLCEDYNKSKDLLERIDGIRNELNDYVNMGKFASLLDAIYEIMYILYKLHTMDKYKGKKLMLKNENNLYEKLINLYCKKRTNEYIPIDDCIYDELVKVISSSQNCFSISSYMYNPLNNKIDDWKAECSDALALIISYVNASIRLLLPDLLKGEMFKQYYFCMNLFEVSGTLMLDLKKSYSKLTGNYYINYGNAYNYILMEEKK